MNRLTITIESKGGPTKGSLIPIGLTGKLSGFLGTAANNKMLEPKGEILADYESIKLSWKCERGVKDTF